MRIKKVGLEDIEIQAVTGAITNIDFLKKVRQKLRPEHFKSTYSTVVLKWVFDYYDAYGKAPKQEILRIYKNNKESIRKEDGKLVKTYLEKLSKDYLRQSRYNADYLYDKVILFIRKRDLQILTEKINNYLEVDKTNLASDELVKFQQIHKESSEIFNPFDSAYIEENFTLKQRGILSLPDALGEMIGPLDRGWLVSFTAPEKRGKTWWLIEMAFQAILQGRNVLFVSFEMSANEINNRLWRRLTAATDGENPVIYIPVVDCRLNQSGECQFKERASRVGLINRDGNYNLKIKGYKPCRACSQINTTFWYEKVRAKQYSKKVVIEKAEQVEKYLGSNLRVKCFPAFSASSQDIKALMNELEVNEGFMTDVLVDDYLDIHSPEVKDYSERGNIDATWKAAKSLSQEKRLLYLTVDQSSKITYDRDIRLYDTSEDKRKNAHVDVKVAMNKIDDVEDLDKIKLLPENIDFLRFSVIAHRHRGVRTSSEVLVLQQKAIGQPLIESVWHRK